VLSIRDLHVEYRQDGVVAEVVRGVSIEIPEGSALALVGESGSGKSTLALSVMKLINPAAGRISGGEVWLDGVNLSSADRQVMRGALRHDIGFIPQDPTTALDPLFTIRSQVAEVLPKARRSVTDQRVTVLLESLGVVDAAHRLKSYPHEFSGGMRQRVAMAIALAKEPKLLIADEPTTALDVTTQLNLLRLLNRLRSERRLTTLFITHDLRVARLLCETVAVMYGGIVVESGAMAQVMKAPCHPYTRALAAVTSGAEVSRTKLAAIPGQPPSPRDLSAGCPFAPRCVRVEDRCRVSLPGERTAGQRTFNCWNPVLS
jgi:oligopeptide/dipeptide ABC transporter ATP-binding protein